MDVKDGELGGVGFTYSPMFWTNNNETIIAVPAFFYTARLLGESGESQSVAY